MPRALVMRLLAAGLAVDAVGVDLEQDGDAVPVGKVLSASPTNPFWRPCPGATTRLSGGPAAAADQTWIDWLSTVPTSLGPSTSCGASLLPCRPQKDLVDGQAARTAEDEGDDLGDVFGGDLSLVVELLDALFGVGVGDVVRQLGGHDTRLDERHADVGQQFQP